MSDPTKAPDDQKLRELILFISARSEGDETFGATKLNKLLFFADYLAYRQLGKSITGQEYQKLDNGPAPRRLLPIIGDMQESGDLVFSERQYFGYVQRRSVALRDPDLSCFSGEEIAIVCQLIEFWHGKTAREISGASHHFPGWQLAETGETIPYDAALADLRKPTAEECAIGGELAPQLKAMSKEFAEQYGEPQGNP